MTVDIKKAQERLNALYKNYDYSDKKNDDKALLHGERLSYIQKERYATESDAERDKRLNNIARGWNKKQGTLSPEQKATAVREYWTCSRSDDEIDNLCKKYNLKKSALMSLGLEGKYLDPAELKSLKEEWVKTYGVRYEIISPGNDMLDYYDEQNDIRKEPMKLSLKPSIIFHYRFRETDWKPKDMRAMFPHIKGDTLMKLLRERCDWLVDVPSQKIVTQDLFEAENFYQEVTGLKATSGIRRLAHEGVMGWQGHLGGWIVKHLGGKKYK